MPGVTEAGSIPPPPGAVLSPDHHFWWDGHGWQPVPAAAPAAPAQPHLGFWARHRLAVAAKHYEKQLADWQQQVTGLQEYLHIVETFTGETSGDTVVLRAGETLFGSITNTSLVETRVSGGHWVSGSSGFSVPVGSIGGHAVRYHVGRTRGHYVQGAPAPAAVDTGTLAITSQRVIFMGSRQTRECAFSKLAGYRHDGGEVTLSVTNRQRPVTVHYGTELDSWFVERFELALAHFRGTVPQLHAQVQALIDQAEAHRPSPPPGAPASR